MVGHGEDELPLPRARHRAPLERRRRTSLGTINLVLASGRIGKPQVRLRHDRRPGQRPGRPRARAEVRSAPGLRGTSPTRSTARTSPAVWGIDEPRDPAARRRLPTRCSARSTRARSRGCSRSASTRRSRCRTTTSSRACSRSSSSSSPSTSSSTTPPGTPTSCCRAACRKRTRASSRRSRGASSRSTRPSICPARRAQDWRIIQDIAAALGRPHGFTFASPREIFEELRIASARAASRTTRASPTRRSKQQMGVFWPCYSEDPQYRRAESIIRARRASSSRAATTRSRRAPARSISRTARPASTSPTTGRPSTTRTPSIRSILTTGRVVSQFLSGTQTRRIGPLVDQYPEPRIEIHPRLAEKLGIADGDWATAETRRGAHHAARRGRHDDPPRHDLHPLPLGGREEPPTSSRSPRRIRSARSRNTRCARCRVAQARRRRRRRYAAGCSSRSSKLVGEDRSDGQAVTTSSSSSIPTAASAARRACRRAPSATRIAASR